MKKTNLNLWAVALTLLAWVAVSSARRSGATVMTRTPWTERQRYGGWGSICCAKEKASDWVWYSLRGCDMWVLSVYSFILKPFLVPLIREAVGSGDDLGARK